MNKSNCQKNTRMFKANSVSVTKKHLLTLILFVVCGPMPSIAAAEPDADDPIIAFELSRHRQLLNTLHSEDAPLTPFVTDGCSGGLSVGWNYLAQKVPQFASMHGTSPPWEQCCVTHDHMYHQGAKQGESKQESFARRLQADLALKDCVLETGANRREELTKIYDIPEKELIVLYQATSELMYRAVRVGGIPCSGLPWRWGFGQPACHD